MVCRALSSSAIAEFSVIYPYAKSTTLPGPAQDEASGKMAVTTKGKKREKKKARSGL